MGAAIYGDTMSNWPGQGGNPKATGGFSTGKKKGLYCMKQMEVGERWAANAVVKGVWGPEDSGQSARMLAYRGVVVLSLGSRPGLWISPGRRWEAKELGSSPTDATYKTEDSISMRGQKETNNPGKHRQNQKIASCGKTKARFVRKGSKICNTGEMRKKALFTERTEPTSQRERSVPPVDKRKAT